MIAFGPIPSRRLGRSLGINNIPPKRCTYSCVYCQIGRTSRMQVKRKSFYSVTEIVDDVRRKLDALMTAGEAVDYLTFVPDGEPTLDAGLGREIEALKSFGMKIAVITNGSLLWREDVRAELMNADWVSLKLDAASDKTWRSINRPYHALELDRIIEGMYTFAKVYKGMLVTETMLVKELTDTDNNIELVGKVLERLHPAKAYVLTPTRPSAEQWVEPVGEDILARACRILRMFVPAVDCIGGYEGNEFSYTGELEKEMLDITSVHPMREDAVRELLAKANTDWTVVQRLLDTKQLVASEYQGKRFYSKNLHELQTREEKRQ
jgi:wyosine [tRNA(Phe)-imidazoG37] synthetase (radical SAM superfamily)